MPRTRPRSSVNAAPDVCRASASSCRACSGSRLRSCSANPRLMPSATNLAWAPSCRSRSIRRISAADTSTTSARDSANTATRSLRYQLRLGDSSATATRALMLQKQVGRQPPEEQRQQAVKDGDQIDGQSGRAVVEQPGQIPPGRRIPGLAGQRDQHVGRGDRQVGRRDLDPSSWPAHRRCSSASRRKQRQADRHQRNADRHRNHADGRHGDTEQGQPEGGQHRQPHGGTRPRCARSIRSSPRLHSGRRNPGAGGTSTTPGWGAGAPVRLRPPARVDPSTRLPTDRTREPGASNVQHVEPDRRNDGR